MNHLLKGDCNRAEKITDDIIRKLFELHDLLRGREAGQGMKVKFKFTQDFKMNDSYSTSRGYKFDLELHLDVTVAGTDIVSSIE